MLRPTRAASRRPDAAAEPQHRAPGRAAIRRTERSCADAKGARHDRRSPSSSSAASARPAAASSGGSPHAASPPAPSRAEPARASTGPTAPPGSRRWPAPPRPTSPTSPTSRCRRPPTTSPPSPRRRPRRACATSCCSPAAARTGRSPARRGCARRRSTTPCCAPPGSPRTSARAAFRDGILAGELALPAGAVREPFVSADDIADAAVAALTDPAHRNRTYELTGPRLLSFADAVAEVAAATGRPVAYRHGPGRRLPRRPRAPRASTTACSG